MKQLVAPIATLLMVLCFVSCVQPAEKYLIGVSQCSEDSWRTKLKSELEQATYFNEDVQLVILSANDNIEQQRQQIRSLINQRVDLLIVSPQQTGNLTDVITEARDAGIPVILFDRKTGASNYTAFMGADNYLIGQMLGEYAAGQLGGRGNIIEITGEHGSSPAIERHNGFNDAIRRYPHMHIIGFTEGDWKQPSGEKAVIQILDSIHRVNPDLRDYQIDCIFGGNDRMVAGARSGINKFIQCHPEVSINNPASILYLGVDALPTPGGGIEKVRDGIITVSAIYPTHGDEVLQLALNILKGNPYDQETLMETSLVTQANANVLLMQHKEVERQSNYIRRMHTRTDQILTLVGTQQTIMVMIIFLVAILAGFSVFLIKAYRTKHRLNEELRRKNEEINTEKAIVEHQRDQLEEQRDKLLDAISPREEPSAETEGTQKNQFLDRFLKCLDKRIGDSNLSVEEIGNELGVSRVQLYRKVKMMTGRTPVEIIREERLRRAKILLNDSSLTISEIAYSVGFSAPSYFTKCYKDYYGKAPSIKND